MPLESLLNYASICRVPFTIITLVKINRGIVINNAARCVIYDCNMFIVQTTAYSKNLSN
jgi:hypothetical protein